MQKHFLLLISLACIINVSAQKPVVKRVLTETSIVKDTAGNVIPYVLWKGLMALGDHTLKPENPSPENSAFILHRLSAEQKQRLLETLPKPTESKFFKTGSSFTGFNEKDIEGKKFKLKELKEKVIVLNFWFINCSPCRLEIPELNEVVESFKDNKDVIFIAVALDEKSEIKEFLKRLPFKYNIIDRGASIASFYGISSYPTHVVVDKKGKVKFHTTGLARNTVHWVKKSIEEALTASDAPMSNAPGY
jgi:thiol-disulfide isomerase/thioredoxin